MRKDFDSARRRAAARKAALLLAAAAVLWLSNACTATCTGEDDTTADSAVMRFGKADIGTRTTLYGADDLRRDGAAFAVWGAMYPIGGPATNCVPVFDGTPVAYREPEAVWSYAEPQYWFPGFVYNFRALFPAAIGSTPLAAEARDLDRGDALYVAVTDFDLTQGVDLLAASTAPYQCAYGAKWPTVNGAQATTVDFAFRHLLCGITVTGAVDAALGNGVGIVIESMKVYGMCSRGSWSGAAFGTAAAPVGTWTPSAAYATTADNPYAVLVAAAADASAKPIATGGPVTMNAGDEHDFMAAGDMLLMMPQHLDDGFVLEVGYRYTGNGAEGELRTVRASLASTSAALSEGWVAGRKYRYRFTVGASDYILFAAPEVTPWQDASGGSIRIE